MPPTDWDLTNGHAYILNRNSKRNHAAAGRLNLQHYLWKGGLQYSIHPSISATLPQTAAIAEVASGTCLWLTDVAHEFPKAHVDGLDYNHNLAPHPSWLPPNTSLRHWNVFEAPPDDLVGKYDYVHTRLLVLVVESKNPAPIIRNLIKLLKPGGYLQWDDINVEACSIQKADPALKTPALDQLQNWSAAGGRHEWTVSLHRFFADEGLQDTAIDFFDDPPELLRAHGEVHFLTLEEWAEGLLETGQPETAAHYFGLLEKAYEESLSGAALSIPRVVCTGRKPL